MFKSFDTLGFKPGDTVKCVKSEYSKLYEVGKTYKLIKEKSCTIIPGGWTGFSAEWEKVEELEYEDHWHLNDGKVTIPDDADKLEKDGSIVAFRKRKQPEFKFGDMVKHKNGYTYVVVSKDQEGVHRIISENLLHSVTAFTDNLTKI